MLRQPSRCVFLVLVVLLSPVPYPPKVVALSQQNSEHHLRIGTRPSPLARQQAQTVATALQESHSSCISTELVLIDSLSEHKANVDKVIQDLPLAMTPAIDFTSMIDNAIISGEVDVGVHSLKDIPPSRRWKSELVIGACLPRVCPLDVLIVKVGTATCLDDLPLGARIGSASARRQSQLLAIRPDCKCINLRGNVHTRLEAIDNGLVDALVMAKAGLDRLGIVSSFENKVVTVLDSQQVLPCPGQGIVGVVCRKDNNLVQALLHAMNDKHASAAAIAERAVLNTVDGLAPWDGRPPIAAYMEKIETDWLLRALLATPDGKDVLRAERCIPFRECRNEHDAMALGTELGNELLRNAGVDFFSITRV